MVLKVWLVSAEFMYPVTPVASWWLPCCNPTPIAVLPRFNLNAPELAFTPIVNAAITKILLVLKNGVMDTLIPLLGHAVQVFAVTVSAVGVPSDVDFTCKTVPTGIPPEVCH